jgi:DNA polymerase-3 subunit delta
VYLLLGPELYLRNQAVGLLKQVIPREALAFNYAEFDAKSAAANQIVEAANTFPMMSRLRLVIVNDVNSLLETEQDALIAYLGGPSARTILVLVASDLDKRTVFFRRLCEGSCVLEFPQLKDFALKNWAGEYIRRQGRRISPAALGRLMDLAGSDMLSLVNEVEKLLLYSPDSKEISESAIEQLVPSSRLHKLYELTDAIGRKDRPNAIRLIANILESGEPALRVSATFANHFRQVLIARELLDSGQVDTRAIAAAALVNPRWVENLIRTARLIDSRTAREMCLRTAEIDRRLKSSGGDPKLILESLVHSL